MSLAVAIGVVVAIMMTAIVVVAGGARPDREGRTGANRLALAREGAGLTLRACGLAARGLVAGRALW